MCTNCYESQSISVTDSTCLLVCLQHLKVFVCVRAPDHPRTTTPCCIWHTSHCFGFFGRCLCVVRFWSNVVCCCFVARGTWQTLTRIEDAAGKKTRFLEKKNINKISFYFLVIQNTSRRKLTAREVYAFHLAARYLFYFKKGKQSGIFSLPRCWDNLILSNFIKDATVNT